MGKAYNQIPRALQKKALMVPLHLATIAALTPDRIEQQLAIEDSMGDPPLVTNAA
jgi:hypothetical protein